MTNITLSATDTVTESAADAAPAGHSNPLAILDKIEVNPAEFEIGDELGHGEFGASFECFASRVPILRFRRCSVACGSAGRTAR